jgi:hypothetical protein
MQAIGNKFETMADQASMGEEERAKTLARLYTMFKRPMSRVTEQDVVATIARIHRVAALREASVEELQAELYRRTEGEPIAELEDRLTINATFRSMAC